MPHVRLTHPDRVDLPFRQGQSDEYSRQAVASITSELGTDRVSLVHTETREGERSIRGQVTAPRRARNDADTDDWRQALANYVDLLESHVDEFQGDGYTLVDEELDIEKSAVLESVEWSMSPGQPFDFEYDASVLIGRGTFESRAISRREPTVNDSQSTMLVIDGESLPGFRDYRVNRSVGIEVNPVFDRDSAENNDAVFSEGVRQTITFEGTITGTKTERQAKDADLDALVSTADPVTCSTFFPGYELEGYVTAYNSDLEARFSDDHHHYRIEFVEGRRA